MDNDSDGPRDQQSTSNRDQQFSNNSAFDSLQVLNEVQQAQVVSTMFSELPLQKRNHVQ